jgi:hypothetical protein
LGVDYYNSLLPADWQATQAFVSSFDALNSGYLRDVGTYEYDAIAALGLLACAVAPTGPLNATFGADVWNARTTLEFTGLSGTVKFDAIGNRDLSTAQFELSNLLVAPDGSWTVPRVAKYNNSRWDWAPAARRSDSTMVYMGGSSERPPDRWLPPLVTDEHYHPEGLVYAIYTFNCALLVLAGYFAAWTVLNRRHPLLRASQFEFLLLIVFGSVISLTSVFFLARDHRDMAPRVVSGNSTRGGVYPSLDRACNAQVWLCGTSFFLAVCLAFHSTLGLDLLHRLLTL